MGQRTDASVCLIVRTQAELVVSRNYYATHDAVHTYIIYTCAIIQMCMAVCIIYSVYVAIHVYQSRGTILWLTT